MELIDTQEAARRLGIRDATVRQAVIAGKLMAAGKIGNAWAFDVTEIERYARERRPNTRVSQRGGARKERSKNE